MKSLLHHFVALNTLKFSAFGVTTLLSPQLHTHMTTSSNSSLSSNRSQWKCGEYPSLSNSHQYRSTSMMLSSSTLSSLFTEVTSFHTSRKNQELSITGLDTTHLLFGSSTRSETCSKIFMLSNYKSSLLSPEK